MPLTRLVREGVLTDGTGYDQQSLTWRKATPIIRHGEVIGMATVDRVIEDDATWLVADVISESDEDLTDLPFTLEIDAAVERFENGPEPGHWVEAGVLQRIEVDTRPPRVTFDQLNQLNPPEVDDYQAEAAAILETFQIEDEDEIVAVEMAGEMLRWQGILAIEGEGTGDGRMFDPDAIYWEDSQAPWPLKFDRDEGDHSAAIIGEITRVWRDGSNIMGEGILHNLSTDPETLELVNRTVELLQSENGAVPGVSIEVDSEVAEVRVDQEAWEEWQREVEDILNDEVPEAEDPTVVDGRVVMDRFRFDDWLYVTTEGRFRGAAIVDRPAFADARIAIAASGAPLTRMWLVEGETITAHAAAATIDFDAPPRTWFEMDEPGEDDPRVVWVNEEGAPCTADSEGARPWGVPLTVTADGQVFGHLASWQDCHTGFEDRCVTPPRSSSGYAWFHTGAVTAEDGSQVATGRITVDTSHAPHRMNAAGAVAHYDQTGHAVADVHVSDGEMGPWMAGWVRPWATAQQRHELTAHPPSGDWRPRGGSTELIGVLAVNVAGFPMPRSVATYRAGELASLVASGLPPVSEAIDDGVPAEILDRLSLVEARLEAGDVLRELESVS